MGKNPSIFFSSWFSCGFKDFRASITCSVPWYLIVFICFSNALPSREYANLACSIILLWSDGNISSPVRNSYLSILPDNDPYIFDASLLISCCNFLFLILLSILMISCYIFSKRLFLKREELSDVRVESITKNKYGFAVHFLYTFIKSWKSISNEWLNAVCLIALLFGLFITK